MDKIIAIIARTQNLRELQVANTIKLLDGGATIPFISRYRKEMTGGLDEVQIANIQLQNEKLQELRKQKALTQEELAGILCVTRQAVSKWESGASLPEVTRIVPLAQALKCSFSAHTTKGKTFKEKEIQNVIYMLSQMFNLSEG